MRDIQISDHFDYSTILLFSLPTIETLIVDSTYVVADGFFISNYIGAEAFAAEKSNLAEIWVNADERKSGMTLLFQDCERLEYRYSFGQNIVLVSWGKDDRN